LTVSLECRLVSLKVVDYLTLRAILAMLSSLFLSLALGRFFINKLQEMQISQVIRTDRFFGNF
jgi:phospho-N-acetylmuramoyl-pentapeptide-transferase